MTVLEAIAAGCRHKHTILAEGCGSAEQVARELQRLRRAGLIEYAGPSTPGWRLTRQGLTTVAWRRALTRPDPDAR